MEAVTLNTNPAIVGLKNFRRIATGIDPAPLINALRAHTGIWREVTLRQDYAGSAHAATETVFLRAPASLVNVLDELDCMDMPAIQRLSPAVLDTMGRLSDAVGVREWGRAMIVKLREGGCITPHTDQGAYARYYARFHYVLHSTRGCHFTVGDETVHMATGELWWFNHQVEHHVVNDGPVRIHLIFDATAPGYTGALGG